MVNPQALKLSGVDIIAWIHMCISHNNPVAQSAKLYGGPQLMHLHLQGTGSSSQLLSYMSALFVHGLVYLSHWLRRGESSCERTSRAQVLVARFRPTKGITGLKQ